MSFFHGATNVMIVGHPRFNIIQGSRPVEEGLGILQQQVAPGALHNSEERSDAPKCDPGTRVALQEEILAWLDDTDNTQPAMWLHGEPGVGKSAVAQTIAQLCAERGQLSSSFFLARDNPDRNNEKKLVPTLAHQMSTQIPETRSHISTAIFRNPRIFEGSVQAQFNGLIIVPLSRVKVDADATSKPKLIIIDGLDEGENFSTQDEIVKAFVSSLSTKRDKLKIPHKILIVSRPETNIKAAFDDPDISASTKRLSLDEKWVPNAGDDAEIQAQAQDLVTT